MATTKHSGPKPEGASASQLITNRIADLGGWRGEMLGRIRALIKETDPEILEEWKWMGTPVWSHDGIVCTGESYKKVVKMTFAKGAFLKDPSGLFNSSLDGNMRRAIDVHEGEKLDERALKALILAAIELNSSGKKKKAAPTKPAASPKSAAPAKRAALRKAAAPAKRAPVKRAAPAKRAAAAKRAAPAKRKGR
ncbi:MAG TPA: DUF1801 domain-containing protein [Polyangiaceae bacterium]|nr:DUF1801 domain-containing protein [Polyangiaceae bacterium]